MRRIQGELEATQARYFELYDLAPLGYMSVGENGLILEANPSAATLLRLALRGGNLGLWDWNAATGALVVNQRWLAMLGLDSAFKSTIEAWNALVHPEDMHKLDGLVEEVILNPAGIDFELEIRARHRDGHFVWILDCGAVVERAPNGSPLRVVGTHMDITTRKLAETALRDSEAHLRALVDWSPAPARIHRAGIVVYVNPAAIKLFGAASADDLIGKSLLDRIHPDSREAALARLRDTSDQAFAAPPIELRFTRMDGTPLDVEVAGTSVTFKGEPAVYAALHDVTQRKGDLAAMRAMLRRFHSVLANLSEAVLLVSESGRIELVNQAFCDLFGLAESPEALAGLTARDVIQKVSGAYADPPAGLERIAQLLALGQVVREETVPLSRQRITLRDFVPIVIDGAPYGRLWSHRDVTERERGREALRESEARYRTLIDWMPDPVLVVRDEEFLFVNRAAIQLFGARSAEDLLGTSVFDRVHPDFRALVRERARLQMAPGGHNEPLELKNLKLDGSVLEVEVQSISIAYDAAPATLSLVRDIGVRKAALRELHEVRLRLAGVIESAMDAIVTVDESHQVIVYNAAAAAMFGVPSAQAIGHAIERFIPPRFRKAHGGFVRAFAHDGSTSRTRGGSGQIMALRANGTEFPIEASISHVEVEGHPLFTVIMRDISEKLHVERELRLLAAVIASSPQLVMIADARAPDLPIMFVNPAFEAITGYSMAEVIGRNCRFMQGDDREQPERAQLRAAYASGEPCQVVLRNYRKDGSMFWNELNLSSLRDASGVITHFITVQNDVSVRQRSQLDLRESEIRFRTLAEDAPVMIWMTGPDGRYVFVNRAMLAFTGHTADAQSGISWAADIHPDDVERTRLANDAAIAARVPIAVEYRRRRHDGEYRWLGAAAAPRLDPAGAFCGYIGTLTDITEQKLAEQVLTEGAATLELQVAERTAALSAAVAELEDMTAVVSHDLRAPLHRMAGFAGLLALEEEVRQNPAAMDFAARIIASAERMGELITKLLANARLGRTAIEVADVALGKLVNFYVADVGANLSERRIEWVIEALPTVRCDPIMARQVVQNLIENAVKYSGKRSLARIEIGAVDSPAEHGFYVRDNGVGFSMEYAGQLFGIFKRLHSEGDFPGIGIGLANVLRIMRKHGGRVWVDAALDQGATFFVAFPKRSVPQSASPAAG